MAHALPPDSFDQQLADLLARRAFVEGEPLVRTREAFEARRGERGRRIAMATQEIAAWLPQLAQAIHAARTSLESLGGGGAMQAARTDMQGQVERLLAEDFLRSTPWTWLEHYPRYFSAIAYRVDKLKSGAAGKDQSCMETVRLLWEQYQMVLAKEDADLGTLEEVRWMIEELRVSFFAQPLGTSVKVSPQRIEKRLLGV
jgi:ATP-dependent helicase HrpA